MKSKNGYKAVFFDLDGTLRHSVPLAADVFTQKARELGFDVSDEIERATGRWEHSYWANSDDLREDSETYKGEDAFWNNYTQRRLKAMGADQAKIKKLTPAIRIHMRSKYRHDDWVPPELHEILPSLREAGFKLGVLSNRSQPFAEQMVELNLAHYFEYVKAAGEIGTWKPNPMVFDSMLEHFNVRPNESVYIGDNYYADVVGARAAGMEPILYDPRGLFLDADCTRITSFRELPEIL
jgi:HAD superfamily hydrolase (TIGR01549 family)